MINQVREKFDAHFNISDIIVKVPSTCSIDPYPIYNFFNRFGFVLIQPTLPQSFKTELAALQQYFGNIIYHKRSNSNGISLIKPMLGFPDYTGTTNIATELHTDGACSSKPPPKVVILQCETPSYLGGESLLLSCKLLYEHLTKCIPKKDLDALFHPNAFTITRDQQTSKRAVFYYENNRIFTIFRGNNTAHIQPLPEAETAFEAIKSLTQDKNKILQFKLKKHQILVIDNTSVMHGRTQFPEDSTRKLNRLFLDGNIEQRDKIYFGF